MHMMRYLTYYLYKVHTKTLFSTWTHSKLIPKRKRKRNYSCPKSSRERNRTEYNKLYGLDFDLKEEQLREG